MIRHIALFELRRLLRSPFAWTVLAIVQFIHALLFYLFLSRYLEQTDAISGAGLTAIVVAGYYQSSGLIMLLITPFLTMRLFSEEMRTGTIRLLLSSPVSATTLVLGKYLGMSLFMLATLGLLSLIPASLMAGTVLDYGQFAAGLLGMTLLLSAFTAAGLFTSTLFRQPPIAAVCTLALLLFLWTSHLAGSSDGSNGGSVISYLSLLQHFTSLTDGIFRTSDLAYFLILTATFLLLAVWRLDAMRTRS
jgi:ABC-2 type transport system permease protein